MSKSNVKRGPKPEKRHRIIVELRRLKRAATSADLAVETAFMDTLKRAGIVKVAGKAEKEGKGRKPNLYALTPAGQGKASSLLRTG